MITEILLIDNNNILLLHCYLLIDTPHNAVLVTKRWINCFHFYFYLHDRERETSSYFFIKGKKREEQSKFKPKAVQLYKMID